MEMINKPLHNTNQKGGINWNIRLLNELDESEEENMNSILIG